MVFAENSRAIHAITMHDSANTPVRLLLPAEKALLTLAPETPMSSALTCLLWISSV